MISNIDNYIAYQIPRQGLYEFDSPDTWVGPGDTSSTMLTGTRDIGFNFDWCSSSYSSIYLNTRCWFSFDDSTNHNVSANLSEHTGKSICALHNWWHTAETDGYVKTETQGSAPYRRFVIGWRVRHHNESASDHYTYTLQAILYETLNRIEFRYSDIEETGSATNEMEALILVKDDTTGDTTKRRNLVSGSGIAPIAEGFEDQTVGAYSPGTGWFRNNMNSSSPWMIDFNGTPSSNTGADHASTGTYYLHYEASSPNFPEKSASFGYTEWDLTTCSYSEVIEFDWHAYGGTMGEMVLYGYDLDSLATSSLWSQSGSYQTADWKPYEHETISLGSFYGKRLRLEFVYTSSISFYGDFCIDSISLHSTVHKYGGSSYSRYLYDSVPTADWRIEPNFPLYNHFVPLGAEDLVNYVPDSLDAMISMLANVNWLYANHCPPLINISPYAVEDANTYFVVPCPASQDDLTYEIKAGLYSSTGGDLIVETYTDNASDPQPTTSGDWSYLQAMAESGSSASTHYWVEDTLTLTGSVDFLRFKVHTGGLDTVQLQSLLIRPSASLEINPTASYPSGFEPMGIGQLIQHGGAIHPELLNRAWRNVARILRDRQQMAWSFVQGSTPDERPGTSTARVVRALGWAPCSIPAQYGASLEAHIGAYDNGTTGTLYVGEFAGNRVAFDVEDNGSEYRYQSGSFTIDSVEPVIYSECSPSNTMFPLYQVVFWKPGD